MPDAAQFSSLYRYLGSHGKKDYIRSKQPPPYIMHVVYYLTSGIAGHGYASLRIHVLWLHGAEPLAVVPAVMAQCVISNDDTVCDFKCARVCTENEAEVADGRTTCMGQHG
jgi:hypothetical protein